MTDTESRLARYSSIATTVCVVSGTGVAQVQYTDIEPDAILGRNGQGYVLDLDGNGAGDFRFRFYKSRYGTSFYQYASVYGELDSWIATTGYYAAPLDYGVLINSGMTGSGTATLFYFSSYRSGGEVVTYRYGYWFGQDKYLGVSIDRLGQTYYGWIRVSVPPNGGAIRIQEYAIETNPDTPVKAGSKTSVTFLSEKEKKKLELVLDSSNAYIAVQCSSSKLTGGSVTVFNQMGQVLRYEAISKGIPFEYLGLDNGKYTVVIEFDQGMAYYSMTVDNP